MGRYGFLQRYLTRKDLLAIRVDPDTQQPFRNKKGLCVTVGANEPGELLMRISDPALFTGYYLDPVATQKKVLENVVKPGDAWFRSGDLMQRNEDGYWYFIDRLGDTFRWKSENVSTTVCDPCCPTTRLYTLNHLSYFFWRSSGGCRSLSRLRKSG